MPIVLLEPTHPRAAESRPSQILRGRGALIIAAVALGAALQVNFGQYHPIAIELLCVSAMAAGMGAWGFVRHGRIGPSDVAVRLGLVTALAFQFTLLLFAAPGAQSASAPWIFRAGVALAGAAAVAAGLWPAANRLAVAIIPALYLLLGLWVLKAAPPPPVDLVVFQRDAGAALLHGRDPYAIDFPNLYSHPERYYDPSVVVAGRLKFGYPYPPLGLLLSLPAIWAGDFRILHLVAMTLAGLLMIRARPGVIATLAGTLFLFTPRTFFVLEAGFTEPVVVLLLSATLYAACRGWNLLPVIFGLFLSSKQYLILALPLGLLLFQQHGETHPRRRRAMIPLGISIGVAAMTMAPFFAWNPSAFLRSVVALQFHQPIRSDALSILPRLIRFTGWSGLLVIPFAAALGLVTLAERRFPQTPAGFAVGLALAFLVFFATNKQAFCGYYILVLAAFCWALAVPWSPARVRRRMSKAAEVTTAIAAVAGSGTGWTESSVAPT
jgi:hypothetical protein